MIEFDLNNRVAIVTGGAQGFGLAITERFIQSGLRFWARVFQSDTLCWLGST